MILLKLALKNLISRKSSFVISSFISFCIMLFFVFNAIIDRSEKGIKQNYINSLTSDVVIRPLTEMPYSLFGDETPVTGSINKIPLLPDCSEIMGIVGKQSNIQNKMGQFTALAVMEYEGGRAAVTLFGVNTSEYFEMLSALKLEQGELLSAENTQGLLISNSVASKYSLSVGSAVKVLVADGLSSKIRKLTVQGIYSYPSENTTFDDLLIVNEAFVVDIMDYSYASAETSESAEGTFIEDFDIDSFFEEESDSAFDNLDEAFLSDNDSEETVEHGYNFILCKSDKPGKTIKNLNKEFKQQGIQAQAVNWRNGAGNRAIYINILRLILNAGVYIILLVGFIIVDNTLIINVLDRIKEIGTIRAIGGKRWFISLEFMLETLFLSLFSFVVGVLLGSFVCLIINKLAIPLNNSFLIQLMAGKSLSAGFSLSNFGYCLTVSILIGCVSWIYPVTTALRITPVEAMREA